MLLLLKIVNFAYFLFYSFYLGILGNWLWGTLKEHVNMFIFFLISVIIVSY
jgi:hypothetical protein